MFFLGQVSKHCFLILLIFCGFTGVEVPAKTSKVGFGRFFEKGCLKGAARDSFGAFLGYGTGMGTRSWFSLKVKMDDFLDEKGAGVRWELQNLRSSASLLYLILASSSGVWSRVIWLEIFVGFEKALRTLWLAGATGKATFFGGRPLLGVCGAQGVFTEFIYKEIKCI